MKSDSKIRTTVNFLQSRIDYLKLKALEHEIPYKTLMKLCIDMYIAKSDKANFKESSLAYQPDGESFQKVHVSMLPAEYDVYFDLKKVSRISFSLIVALAIDTYLETVLSQNQEFSYPVTVYTKLCISKNKMPIYVFSWSENEKIDEIRKILRE
jgi:hypothetical protein